MIITKKEVEYVARLARLALSEQEKEHYTSQLESILKYVEKLKEADTAAVAPTAHPFFTKTVWREDKTAGGQCQDAILKNAPDSEERFFKVPKVIE